MRVKHSILAFALLIAAGLAVSAMAQEEPAGPPPQGGGQGGPGGPGGRGGPGGGFHLLPRFAEQDLKLTADQKKQIAELEKDTKAKLYKILSADQQKTLEQARPPRPGQAGASGRSGQARGRRGQGGPGQGGPGQGGPGQGGPGEDGPGGGPKGGPDSSARPQRPAGE